MIVKCMSRKTNNSGQLIRYVLRYVLNDEKNIDTINKSSNLRSKILIRHNIRSRSLKGFVKEFQENEKYRIVHRKDSVRLFHHVIAFSSKDREHINDKLLKDISEKFIALRGENNLFLGAAHFNKESIHIHCIVSGTNVAGYSSRISKQQLHHLKLSLQKYQLEIYPKLVNSLPEHGIKNKRLDKEVIIQKVKAERQTNKQTLIECLEKTYSNSKSQEHFLSQLIKLGNKPYYINGALQGVKFEGKKYRIARLGFDKSKLRELDKIKIIEDKTLSELKSLREGRSKEQKRTINEPDIKKSTPVTLDQNEQRLMDELSEIRSDNDSKELERSEADQNYGRELVTEEFNNNDVQFKNEMEEAV